TQKLDFIIDTLLSEPTITLDSADDSAAGDNITNVKMPGFTLGNIDADVTKVVVTVAHDGKNQQIELIKNGGVWRFTPGAAWSDGDYTLTVKVEDKAGNTNYSAPLTVTIDTQTSIDRIELLNDTGIVGDNLTNEARPQFHITVPTDVNSVQLSLDGGINWVNATLTSDGVWEYIWPTDLVENTYTLTVKATDVAGNTATETLNFIIDTTLSTPTITLDSADDSGTANDNKTNVKTPGFIIGGIDSDVTQVVVQVMRDGHSEEVELTQTNGQWRFVPGSAWTDGDYTLTVTVKDEAGNIRHSAPLTVTIDTQIAIDHIELVNDSGIPNDNLTNNVRPHFQVTVPTDVNVVRLSIDGGKTWLTAAQKAAGVWEYIWPDDVTDGSHTLTVEATDEAGNKATQTLDFTIDTTLSVPTLSLDSADDSGIAGDNITNVKTPGFTLNNIDTDVSRVIVEVMHNGIKQEVPLVQTGGQWRFAPTSDWADGDYILTVKVEDRAGNVKQSAPLTVTVDTHIAIDRIELVNDSGIPDDNLTNEARPHFQVTVPADVNGVRLSIDGGKTWFDATQSATSGVWDYTWLTNVANGPHTLMVEATDKAGNKTTQ
ncbi:Ig-like domain-containing protein, partial [Salmonella enterica]|uniref:Ig-like domain-containing protein n=1 Tax=Salmonella enterica TaxID=28901 RepID=UPI0007C91F27